MPNWKNWSEAIVCNPSEILFPKTEVAVQQIILRAKKDNNQIRIVGSGHSFTALCASNEILVCLDKMQGIVSVDAKKRQATVWAGTKIKILGAELKEKNLAQENLGDIDVQSIAGSIATGTHGTGTSFGNLSTQVVALRIVLGTGEIVDCSETQEPKLFKAAQISLGSLGIITQLTLQLLPSYKLEFTSDKVLTTDILTHLEKYNEENRNFEFYWFPYAEKAQIKCSNITEKPAKAGGAVAYMTDMVLENYLFGLICNAGQLLPSFSSNISRFFSSAVATSNKVNWSHKVYALPRLVKFNEMEYNIPAEAFKDCFSEIVKSFEQERFKVFFPAECRFVKGDDIWLSPAYKRDSAYIAVHQYKGMPHKKYFNYLEDIFKSYNGRPHWGKMHTRTSDSFQDLYPKWNDFLEQRALADPNGLLLNDYLKAIFGI